MEDQRLRARERWPEAFEGLSALQAHALEQALVSSWHEGVEPTVDLVRDVVARVRSEISFDEFKHRVLRRGGIR
ncbi:hypothetical protein [Arthrobacter sp. RCC_34]|uniref:antitoxin VbhA family protein n=1 Tax=Arthrobacter sp. RCC_34 TaxID=3239230 RepID=UPI003523178D